MEFVKLFSMYGVKLEEASCVGRTENCEKRGGGGWKLLAYVCSSQTTPLYVIVLCVTSAKGVTVISHPQLCADGYKSCVLSASLLVWLLLCVCVCIWICIWITNYNRHHSSLPPFESSTRTQNMSRVAVTTPASWTIVPLPPSRNNITVWVFGYVPYREWQMLNSHSDYLLQWCLILTQHCITLTRFGVGKNDSARLGDWLSTNMLLASVTLV
jgi:hypothetical protein